MDDIRFIVTEDGGLHCVLPSAVVGELGWAEALRHLRMWAWLRGLEISRIRPSRHGKLSTRPVAIRFYARLRPPTKRPFRTACLCGWHEVSGNLDAMVLARLIHRRHNPGHFSNDSCLHLGATKTKPFGEVLCLDCNDTLGWDMRAAHG